MADEPEKPIMGIARDMGARLDLHQPIPPIEPVESRVYVPNRTRAARYVEPANSIIAEAREVCATVHDAGSQIDRACAEHYRAGAYDGDREMQIAEAALRRGMALTDVSEALEAMLERDRRRYEDTPAALAFFEKNNAPELAALRRAKEVKA